MRRTSTHSFNPARKGVPHISILRCGKAKPHPSHNLVGAPSKLGLGGVR